MRPAERDCPIVSGGGGRLAGVAAGPSGLQLPGMANTSLLLAGIVALDESPIAAHS